MIETLQRDFLHLNVVQTQGKEKKMGKKQVRL